jgi:hypothetical protein
MSRLGRVYVRLGDSEFLTFCLFDDYCGWLVVAVTHKSGLRQGTDQFLVNCQRSCS